MTIQQTYRDRASLLGTLVLVLALHALIAWLFFLTTRAQTLTADSRGLKIFFIEPPAAKPPPAQPAARTTPSLAGKPATALRHKAAPTAPPPDAGTQVQPPPIDWAEELSRAAQDSSGRQAGPPLKDFGFPHSPQAPSPKSPEFSWSHARTHRVESIPGGGILVNLNDNCVLVFIPLPIVFCQPGKKPANGQLFDHLHDAPAADDANGVP